MSDLAKLPVTIVTGFLGAGKTTLITHLMQNPGGRRLAVVVNEFGDVGVDGEILRGCAIPDCPAENIVELANGCICCTVADDFIPTIEALMALDPRPDHILIETSGLALPKPLLKAFEWPAIRARVTVDGVIALADAEAVAAGRFAPDVAAVDAQRLADDSLDHETPLSEVFEDQIACADIVLLTKPDLAGPEGVARARDLVAAIERLAKSHNILRVKGHASVAGKPMRLLVQAVGARVRHQFDRLWASDEARRGRLVVIAEHDDLRPEEIRAALTDLAPQPAE